MTVELEECKTVDEKSEAIISLRDVKLTLPSAAGPVNILKGIDLDIKPGKVVGLTGPSGSGKSTLLSVIAGLETPTSGDILIAGRSIAGLNEDQLAILRRQHMGIVFQSFHLIPTMTALENVAVPLELAGYDNASERARAELDVVGLSHRVEHYPGQLSGGEQQRVAIARAVCGEVPILLADEPTGNLDADNSAHVIDLLFSLQESRNTTLLVVTHDPKIAARFSRSVVLKDGLVDRQSSSST